MKNRNIFLNRYRWCLCHKNHFCSGQESVNIYIHVQKFWNSLIKNYKDVSPYVYTRDSDIGSSTELSNFSRWFYLRAHIMRHWTKTRQNRRMALVLINIVLLHFTVISWRKKILIYSLRKRKPDDRPFYVGIVGVRRRLLFPVKGIWGERFIFL